jgi:hypothetical protein
MYYVPVFSYLVFLCVYNMYCIAERKANRNNKAKIRRSAS